MTAIFTLEEWWEIANHGTSGDQVWDILCSWKKNREELMSEIVQARQPHQCHGRTIELTEIANKQEG